jgi:hypothetical protein
VGVGTDERDNRRKRKGKKKKNQWRWSKTREEREEKTLPCGSLYERGKRAVNESALTTATMRLVTTAPLLAVFCRGNILN